MTVNKRSTTGGLKCGKTELVIFKPQRRKLDTEIKIKLNRKQLYPSHSVRYLDIKICSNIHNYDTTSPATCKLFQPSFCTNLHGKNSVAVNAIDAWNKTQTSLGDSIHKDLIPNKIKTIMKRMIDSY